MLCHLWLLKLSSSSVSGKNTSPPPPSLRLDFFRFNLNGSRNPFFALGESGWTSLANVTGSPGLRGPGLAGKVLERSLGLVAAPSFREPDSFGSLLCFSGDFSLNKPFTFSVLDLLMVSVRRVLVQKVRAGIWKLSYLKLLEGWFTGGTCRAGCREGSDVPTPAARASPGTRKGPHQDTRKCQVHFRLPSK